MRVLAVASEIFPLVKTGGLADVVGALPTALVRYDVETRVLMPGYPAVIAGLADRQPVHRYKDLFGGPATVLTGTAANLQLIAIDAPHLFDRPGNPYVSIGGVDWPDNWQRFAALAYVAADLGRGAFHAFVPDIVHAHDWQAALVAAYLHFGSGPKARTVLTIHNLAFQGNFPAAIFPDLRIPAEAYALDGVEYYGGVGYLKAGIQFADAITTVSPSYAEEICTPAGGMGLDGLLRVRRGVLSGIANGIDTEIWDPATDPNLPANFTGTTLTRRRTNKRAIEARFGLDQDDGPLFCVVSRLTWQKGMDLLGDCIDALVGAGARLAVLGSGDVALEGLLWSATARHPRRVGIVVGYDEPLAHLLHGGSDAILIPSRFEPCGLTQFHGLRYGCVPIVARVGGLADTIVDANGAAVAAGVATGIQFLPVDAVTFERMILRALELLRDRSVWSSMQKRGMKSDVSWSRSAARYADLYRRLATETA